MRKVVESGRLISYLIVGILLLNDSICQYRMSLSGYLYFPTLFCVDPDSSICMNRCYFSLEVQKVTTTKLQLQHDEIIKRINLNEISIEQDNIFALVQAAA